MNDLRTAAQQALEALQWHYRQGHSNTLGGFRLKIDEKALRELSAALAQQAEPDHETRAELAEQQVVQLAEERDHYRNLWQKAQQAEPLNLRDPAVQKRLVTQWGYVPAAQAEPDLSRCPQCNGPADNGFDRSFPPIPYLCTKCMAEPVQPGAWVASKDGRVIYDDASKDDSLLRVSGDFEDDEQRVRYAKQIVDKLNAAPAQQAEPVAWECKAGGLKPLTQRQYDAQTVATKRHYTRIAPPQRKLVLLTAQELDGVIERHVGGSEITDDMYTSMEQFTRAIEKTSWEKNHE